MTVIDASALLALLRHEPGWEIVEGALESAVISSVNLGEVADRQFRNGFTTRDFRQIVDSLEIGIAPVDIDLAISAAEFRDAGRASGLSQADCICLALARRDSSTVLTADRAWAQFAETLDINIKLIR